MKETAITTSHPRYLDALCRVALARRSSVLSPSFSHSELPVPTCVLVVCSAYPLSVLLLSSVLPALCQAQWRPCIELKRDLLVPCKCAFSTDYPRSLEMNCDRVIFTRDTVTALRNQPIVSVSQRHCGHQTLPEDIINSGLSLRTLDLSSNSIHRLMGRLLQVQPQLRELLLADNLLGDSLNPIFSSNEFHGMSELEILDLSKNGLRSIEEGILKGCDNLVELYLDGNNLTAVPAASLKGPRAIRVLSLSGNNIGKFAYNAKFRDSARLLFYAKRKFRDQNRDKILRPRSISTFCFNLSSF